MVKYKYHYSFDSVEGRVSLTYEEYTILQNCLDEKQIDYSLDDKIKWQSDDWKITERSIFVSSIFFKDVISAVLKFTTKNLGL